MIFRFHEDTISVVFVQEIGGHTIIVPLAKRSLFDSSLIVRTSPPLWAFIAIPNFCGTGRLSHHRPGPDCHAPNHRAAPNVAAETHPQHQ